jgi:hypothetical protein
LVRSAWPKKPGPKSPPILAPPRGRISAPATRWPSPPARSAGSPGR